MASNFNNNNPGYSTLEYDPSPGFKEDRLPQAVVLPPPDYSEKQLHIANDSGLEVVGGGAHQDTFHKVPTHQVPTFQDPTYQGPTQQETTHQASRSRRKWYIVGAVVAVIVIIAAVVGGVLASKGKKNSSQESITSSASTGTTNSAIESASPSPSSTSFSLPAPTISQKRNIAAVSFLANSVNQTRLYYQNDEGKLMEAIPGGTGRALEFDTAAKNGTALAAAVSRRGFPLKISVFYTDEKNIIHDIIYESGKWAAGDLSAKGYTIASNASLAAMYNQCRWCANTTILAFQDANNFIQIGNLTSTGWTTTQLTLHQLENTGLALQPFGWALLEDQLDLYYQRKDLRMAMASWKPPYLTQKAPGWAPDQLWNAVPANTPIATASSYNNVSSGTESWIQVLTAADTGVVVDTWDGARRSWVLHANQHTAMSNIDVNTTYDSLAMTSTGVAFGVVRKNGTQTIESWQLADDFLNWESTGAVDVGTAWTSS